MATYFLRSTHISRGKGSLATRAAAYRSGERIKDERTGLIFDYSDRQDVAYKEVVLPSDLAGRPDMAWTQDRAILWNAMEHAGTRRNSRVAREWLVLVPPELTPAQRVDLVRTFAVELSNTYRCAVDVAIHQPRPGADPRNHHAHLLMTTREVSPEGIGARTKLELVGRDRHERGLGPSLDEYLALRERWAEVTNASLQRAGLNARVDHRSLEQQGIHREPRPPIPDKVFYAERKYGQSRAGDAIRARQRERVEARQKGGADETAVIERQRRQLKEWAIDDFKQKDAQPKRPRWSTLTVSERNELRRQKYAARQKDPVREARMREYRLQQYYKTRAKDPEAFRQSRRTYRSENADEINRKQREYRRDNADELNRTRRENRRNHAAEENSKQREYRSQVKLERTAAEQPAPTAEDSAKRWLEYRQSHGPGPTAEDSARNWLASRSAQQAPDPAPTLPTTDRNRQSDQIATDDSDHKRRPELDHDLEL